MSIDTWCYASLIYWFVIFISLGTMEVIYHFNQNKYNKILRFYRALEIDEFVPFWCATLVLQGAWTLFCLVIWLITK